MCGAVRFEVSAPLRGAVYCHCTRCQRRSGTGFAVTGMTEPGSFRLTRGGEAVGTYDPGDGGWHKKFCSVCGSQVFTTSSEDPDVVGVRFGALDGDPGVRPSAHQFADYAPAWSPVPDDGLPRFPERAPSTAR
jgi:hypothetical protein